MYERENLLRDFITQQEETSARTSRDIELYRKGLCRLNLLRSDGAPLSGAKIRIRQRNHAFRFGANLYLLGEAETAEKNALYEQRFCGFFNMGTIPFYWCDTEPEPGKLRLSADSPRIYRRPAPDLCLDFCDSHGIEPREHALAYEMFFPAWLRSASVPEIKYALEKRMAILGERYAHRFRTIEVTNEMDYWGGTTAFYSEPDFIEWCYKTARKYFPHNELCINEYPLLIWDDRGLPTDKYYANIALNLMRGAPIDAVGMQFHMIYPRDKERENTIRSYNPKKVFQRLDLYARLGKPLQITEISIPCYDDSPAAEKLQADILEALYTIWFSHPSMEQIIYWDLADGYSRTDNPGGDPRRYCGDMTRGGNVFRSGLLRFDMSPKPAYERLQDLITHRWCTETSISSDCNGTAEFRGFYGEYTAEISFGGYRETRTFTLDRAAPTLFLNI